MKIFLLILITVLNISWITSAQNTSQQFLLEELKLDQPGFFLTIPQALISGEQKQVCVTIHGAKPPSRIKIDLKYKEIHYYTDKTVNSGYSCFDIKVPKHTRKTPQYVSIKVQAQLDGIIYSSHNHDPVLIYPQNKHIFIGLDRTIYKPGDKIKLRILVLNNDFLPPEPFMITEVRIRNPHDISVAVWENITTTSGLVHLEHQIYKDGIPGKWRVEVDNEVKHFEVNKYVLPRFNINITHPKIIYYKARYAELNVCSKYSFGKVIKGKAFIKVTDSSSNMKPFYEIKQINSNGCANFRLKNDILNLRDIKRKFPMDDDPKLSIHITATVIEYGTDKIEVENVKIPVDLQEYQMKFISEPIFYPGLPYYGKLQLNNIHADIKKDVVEICYNVAIKKSWNYLNNEKCSNFSVENDNSIHFSILPLRVSVIHLKLSARSLNYTTISDSLLVIRLYSPSNDYVILKVNNSFNKQCGTTQQIMVLYTTEKLPKNENITFYSIIKSKGELYSVNKITKKIQRKQINYKKELKNILGTPHKYHTEGTPIDKFVLKYKLNERIIWKYQILIYYISSNGEVISAIREIDRGPCLRNKVLSYWSQNKMYPGSKATLNIQTNSVSLCSVSVVDNSVEFMGALDNLHPVNLLNKFFVEHPPVQSNRKTCIAQSKKNNQINVPSFYTDPTDGDEWKIRRKRYVFPFAEDYDTYDIFNKFGTVVITNLKLITKHCYSGPKITTFNPAPFQTDHYSLQHDDKIITIRTYFPETWIWELTPVRNFKQIQRELPHSITEWTSNVICVSPSEGVGISPVNKITTYQPFFLNVLTPYSIRKDEILHLRILVFNYMNYGIPVKITMGSSVGIRLLTYKNTASYCILPQDTITHVFPLSGSEVGVNKIHVTAEVDPFFPGHCGPETILNVKDVVVKHLIVEPEGYQVETAKSALLCNEDILTTSNISWRIHIPSNVVPNTASAKLSLNADLLGHPLENLNDLLQIPNGCGEQITSTMAPNLYILKYLESSKNLDSSTRNKIIKNLKIGYHKILNFALKDGSFTPFGYRNDYGSMFLTTFVVRTLKLAKEFIYVDQKVIDRAVSWIFNHQLENGCFDTMFHVFQNMGGTDMENSTAALSSYVIISLTESNIEIPKIIMDNAKYCIRGYSNPDKYTLAISSYALFKIKWYDEANKLLKRLLNIASKQNDMLWWTIKDANSEAVDIEITSYVLLSLLEYNTNENLATAHSVVRWLTSKTGPRGGFKSTQDTVVALDALSKYSSLISRKINLNIQIQAERQNVNYQIKNEDRLKTRKIALKSATNEINVKIRGEGCILVQTVSSYYLKNVPKSESFKVALEVTPVSTVAKCSVATLSPCISYSGPDSHSNMAVLDVSLPSGYKADRASLYKLTESDKESYVEMFEEINDRVVFYFTKLDKEVKCFTFDINEDNYVENRKESVVKIFDYYKPEYENLELYTMENCNNSVEINETSSTTIETITETVSTLSYWDYFDTTVYNNETVTFNMNLDDYL